MAIVRDHGDSDNVLKYLTTVALFCGISCTILMLRFRGFKASFNLSSGKRNGKEQYELAPQVSVSGAYRTSRQEYFGNDNHKDPQNKITPSTTKPPSKAHEAGNIKPSKSTGDLAKASNAPVEARQITPTVSVRLPNQTSKDAKKQLKEQKRLEKEKLAELKKREKLAAQERDKQEKLRKEREKQDAQRAKETKEKEKEGQIKKKAIAPQPNEKTIPPNKATAPQPRVVSRQSGVAPKQNAPPPPPQPNATGQQIQPNASALFQRAERQHTNTLESSISRSSGPPPYSDTPHIVLNKNDNTGNTSFARPDESSSWDMISQHRQQMNRTVGATADKPKQTRLDLRYNVGDPAGGDRGNSDA